MHSEQTSEDIHDLMASVEKNFPDFLARVKLRAADAASISEMKMEVSPPLPVHSIPTFDRTCLRHLSPMLKARFEYASDVHRGFMHWLGADKMSVHLSENGVRQYHQGLRDHWEDSAPMMFEDAQLGLFAITPEVPTDLIYLVWTDSLEPELWLYAGMEEKRFCHLAAFLKWCLA